ncbi:MAG: DUF4112 domain-containing protein [Polyangiales bacterium]
MPRHDPADSWVDPSTPSLDDMSPAERAKRPLSEVAPFTSKLTKVLDDWGLDAIGGFVFPGAGDVVTGTMSFAVLATGLREGVPTIILLRMLLNLLVDVVVGIFPIVGDLFDLFWRANRTYRDLVERYRGGTAKPRGADYALVAVGYLLATLLIVMPALWITSLGFGVAKLFGGE